MKRTFLFLATILVFCNASSFAQLWSGILAPSRAVDWSTNSPGVVGGIPSASWSQCQTSACQTLTSAGSSATAAEINAALASAPANSVVQLAAGTYSLSSGINMAPNVVLRGAGPSSTSLVFSGGTGCGGMGGQICFIDSKGYYYGSSAVAPGASNSATWSGGYSSGTTSITLSNVGSAGIVNGQFINLDQANDNPSAASSVTSGMLVCDNSNGSDGCSLEGGSPGRSSGGVDRNLIQIVQVVSGCASTCSGAGPFTVTITPGLYGVKWNSSQQPGAWWSSSTMQHAGLENLSVDSTGVGNSTESGIYLNNAFNCWVTNVRSIRPNRNHVWIWGSAHNTVQNSYFFGTQNAQSQSYGVESFISSDNLVVNNIFQQVTAPIMTGPSMGSVFAYNFSIDDAYYVTAWLQQAFAWRHDAGALYNLSEGNVTSGYWEDVFHGTGGANTAFRNYATGWESGKSEETTPVQLFSYNRFENFVGNVLGCNNTTSSYPGNCGTPTQTTYQSSAGVGDAGSIYDLGAGNSESSTVVKPDPYVATSLLRWGNYDVAHAANQWNSSEVPSGLSDGYANPVPSSQTLPASFWTATKPSWWGSLPWPAIGPDVTGGNVPGIAGHAYLIPAAVCYLNTMKGPADGTGSVLSFDAQNCYGAATSAQAPAPPTGLTGTVVQ
jgi:hypothetical protein